MALAPLTAADVAAECGVSRETLGRLETYLALLVRWQKAINLVAASTLADPWRRHLLDSAQLAPHLPATARNLLDLGSGAGFPGLVLAIMGARDVHLAESDQRKCVFLREVARETGTNVTVHAERIEALQAFPADVVTARALAPLAELLPMAERFVTPDTVCLFPKGRQAGGELTAARARWKMTVTQVPSRTDPDGSLLVIRGVQRVDAS